MTANGDTRDMYRVCMYVRIKLFKLSLSDFPVFRDSKENTV